ncbi:MAG: hypothetical protein AB7O52_16210 [Planctomycetota bacterium]
MQTRKRTRGRAAALYAVVVGLVLALAPSARATEDHLPFSGTARQVDSGLLTPTVSTVDMTFVVDDVGAALLIVTSPSKTLTVSLIDPALNETFLGGLGAGISGGATLPEDADTNPAVTGKDYVFRLDAPQVGVWTVRVVETVAVTADLPVVTNLWLASAIQGFVVGGGEDYPVGSEVRLGLFLNESTTPLSGFTVAATVFRLGDSTFSPVPITFADDGVAPDFVAGDALHMGAVILVEPGTYDMRATVTGTTPGGTSYRRDLATRFKVVNPQATLVAASLTDDGIDTNGNSLFDVIRIGIDVDVLVAGEYNVRVDLGAASGAQVSANTTGDLPVGVQTVAIDFAAETLRELAENGPYTVPRIRLEAIRAGIPETQDALYNLGSTDPYLIGQLEREPILFGTSIDTGNDCDADGDFDTLAFAVEVDVLNAGTYTYSMSLLDPNGGEIEFLAGSAFLGAGVNILDLEVDGATIGAHGSDGPYTLGNVLFFGAGASIVAGVVAVSTPYLVSDFEAPLTLVPYDVGFESFALAPVVGQGGWGLSAGVSPAAAVVNATAPFAGSRALSILRDPALGDNNLWGAFTPILAAAPELEQEVSLRLRIEGGGGPAYEILVQSPSENFVVAWIRFAANGDILVLQPFGTGIVFVSTGFDWLDAFGSGNYFEVKITVNVLQPVSNQVAIELDGTTVYSGTALGSTFVEQVAVLTNNTAPLQPAYVDDVRLVHRFIQNDCNQNGSPDACDIALGTSLDCNSDGVPNECEADCNANGTADPCDVLATTSPDCNANEIPDECELAAQDCNQNGTLDVCDIASGTSLDCNQNGVPDSCDLAQGVVQDCNGNGIPDECDIASGFSVDCNLNGVPDSCDFAVGTSLDCNLNGTPDECDIGNGVSVDCNGNAIPDECDLASGTSLDCNLNAIPDECDIASGASSDCNTNSVPDECDLVVGTSVDCNANAIPDECDIAGGASADLNGDSVPDECNEFIRGDADFDGTITLADAVGILGYLTGASVVCRDALDTNDDGALDIVDPIYLLSYAFLMGDPPAAPFPGCGTDPSLGDRLDCLGPIAACP